MSAKKRGKMGEKTEEGCHELLKRIKINWSSSHVKILKGSSSSPWERHWFANAT